MPGYHPPRLLLATAPTLDAMHDCIARFYCGESKNLNRTGPDAWAVCWTDDEPLPGVYVRRDGKRFVFEMDNPRHQATDPGPDGKPQLVIPGCEHAPSATVAARRADEPMRPKAAQVHTMPERGLWGDHGQGELFG